MKQLVKDIVHILLVKLYWATAAVWIAVMLIGLLKRDGLWTVVMLEEIAPVALGVIVVGFIHWVILYRKEIKK